jgi:peroxiredoxin
MNKGNIIYIILIIIITPLFCFSQDNRGYIVNVGEDAPLFKTVTNTGEIFDLSEQKGKVVMLQFTASWCSVCIKEMPFIEDEIWNVYKNSDDFVLAGIDKGESLEQIEKLITKTNISYPICLDQQSEIFELYAEKKAGVTRNIIIDKDGKIIFLTRLFNKKEFDEMKEIIKEYLLNQ